MTRTSMVIDAIGCGIVLLLVLGVLAVVFGAAARLWGLL